MPTIADIEPKEIPQDREAWQECTKHVGRRGAPWRSWVGYGPAAGAIFDIIHALAARRISLNDEARAVN